MSQTKKRSPLWFYVVLIVILVGCFTALDFYLKSLDTEMEQIAANSPDTKAKEVFTEYFDPAGAEKLLDLAGVHVTGFEQQKDLVAMFADTLHTKLLLHCTERRSDGGGYEVLSKDGTVGSFAISRDADGNWEPENVRVTVTFNHSVRIEATEDAVVYVNGIRLGDEQLAASDDTENDPTDPDGVTYLTYIVGNLIADPNVTAVDSDNVKIKPTVSKPDYYRFKTEKRVVPFPEEEMQTVQDDVYAVVLYANGMYIGNDPRRGLLPGSDLFEDYRSIRKEGFEAPFVIDAGIDRFDVSDYQPQPDASFTVNTKFVLFYALQNDPEQKIEKQYDLNVSFAKDEEGVFRISAIDGNLEGAPKGED